MNSRVLWPGIVVSVALVVYWLSSLSAPSVNSFLESHWQHPIPEQGNPPAHYSAIEASLDPQACGSCHVAQFQQWQSSLHSHTMGPGIQWQLRLTDLETTKSCMRCHAPMMEQLALMSQQRGWSKTTESPPAHIPADLHDKGLVCAACHVRQHVRYGPAAIDDTADTTVHDGFVEHDAFSDSRFCATCHQFPETGPRINGKLHEDTYNQWQASRFREQGIHCQSCHMPDRRHLWRGIHDEAMTRSALEVQFEIIEATPGVFSVNAHVTNSGVGHHFPTYLVPEVLLSLEYLDASSDVTVLDRYVIAWRANLELTAELFDQRLAAGDSTLLSGEVRRADRAGKVRLRVSVAPRRHYVRTFDSYLRANGESLDDGTLLLLKQAIDEAKAVDYEFIAAERAL